MFIFIIYNSSMIPVYNFTQSKHTTFRANTNSSIPIQASDSSTLFTRFIQFKEGDRSVVHSNSIYGHLVCKQRFTGVSSVCSIGSSKPITTAVPSTYMTCQNKSKYVSLCLFKTFFFPKKRIRSMKIFLLFIFIFKWNEVWNLYSKSTAEELQSSQPIHYTVYSMIAVSDSKYILSQEKSILLKKPVWSTSILSATTVLQFKTGSLKLQANCY